MVDSPRQYLKITNFLLTQDEPENPLYPQVKSRSLVAKLRIKSEKADA